MEALHTYNITIKSGLGGLQKWTEEDIIIMERMTQASTLEKQIVNKVRLYLQVATLSDLTSADGKTISSEILNGQREYLNPSPSRNRYDWPDITKPTKAEIKVWQNAIRCIFVQTGRNNQQTCLDNMKWIEAAVNYSSWVHSEGQDNLFQRQSKNWHVFQRQEPGRTRSTASVYRVSHEVRTCIPADATPVTVVHHSANTVTISSKGKRGQKSQNNSIDIPWVLRNINSSEYAERRLLNTLQTPQGGEIISDGSYKAGITTYGFIACYEYQHHFPTLDELATECITGKNRVIGHTQDNNSYRGKVAGILAAITTVNYLCDKYNIASGRCKIICDNQGALKASFNHRNPTH
jgi:hypothetical protein